MQAQVCTHFSLSGQTKRRGNTQLADRLLKLGLDSFSDSEVIEMLFSLILSHDKYKKQARKCINHFGSLRMVIEASPEDLWQSGIAPEGITCIRLISEVPKRVLREKIAGKPFYQSSQDVFDYLYYSMRGLKKEIFKIIYLNGRNQIIETLDLFNGTLNNIPISPREILENAIKYRAISMIFVHNHPSGDPIPSKGDKLITRDLVFIGSIVEIKVLDHIIIGDNSHFSFCDEGLIEKYEDSFLNLRMKNRELRLSCDQT